MREYRAMLSDNGLTCLEPMREFKDCVATSAKEVADLMVSEFNMDSYADEVNYCVYADPSLHVLGIVEVGHGNTFSSPAPLTNMFRGALLLNATGVILVHNHPSGRSKPSEPDKDTFKDASKCGRLLGIEMLDSIVIAKDGFSSIKEELKTGKSRLTDILEGKR